MKFMLIFPFALLMAIGSASASSDDNDVVIYQFKGTVSEFTTGYPNSPLVGLESDTLSLPDNHIIKFIYTRTSKKLLSQLRQSFGLPQFWGPDFPAEGDSVAHSWMPAEDNRVFELTLTYTFMNGAWLETLSRREYVGSPPEANNSINIGETDYFE